MRPLRRVAGIAALLVVVAALAGTAAGRGILKLSPDKHAVHGLNRLAFGPRAGDVDEVRRLGVDKWIRQQLQPAQIPESPVLVAKLQPLASVQLATWEIAEISQPPQAVMRMSTSSMTQPLPADQMRKLLTGTVDERRAILTSSTGDVRRQLLVAAPRQAFDGLPELQQESERARQIEDEIRQRQVQEQQRRLRPPLAELLTPEQSRDLQRGTDAEKTAVLQSFDAEKRTLIFRSLQPQAVPASFRREALRVMNPQQAVFNELVEARLLRAVYSTRQLEEVLVDFWMNHFNVFSGKGQVRLFLTSYERDAIRPHVLGRFHDMLLATARHPAMLFYLDNYQSQAPRDDLQVSLPVSARRPGLNENYGRELMELHTLGVDGGYTQDDVVNVARAFTGWTIFEPARYGEFQFNPAMHDRGEKVVLGQVIPRGGGESDGVRVLAILARHPSTARFISRKLARRFVADDPPAALVDRMAATFARTDGDLRAVMETLLFAPEFLSADAWQAKTKSPFEMMVSSLRALGADVTDTTALAQQLTELGQPLYGKAEPTGYPDAGDAWVNSAGLLARLNFASALTARRIQGVTVNPDLIGSGDVRRAAIQILGIEPSPQVLGAITSGPEGTVPSPATLATTLIGSPSFQRR